MKTKICIATCALILLFSTIATQARTSWGLAFPKESGGRPEGNATAEYLAQFDAYFIGAEDDKVIYLTFDAGYENNFTPGILETLKKHNAPAAFFLVGTYIRDNPELSQRIVNEGHIIANHTMNHPDMSKISCKNSFAKELALVEEQYKAVIGSDIPKFYRPPSGTYCESNLKHAQELGYKTIFWSAAYKDWENNNQPSREEAFSKLIPRTHPGAIILLHNTSQTNAMILDELLTQYTEMGYVFKCLNYLTERSLGTSVLG